MPNPALWALDVSALCGTGESLCSEPESAEDMDRKYSDRPCTIRGLSVVNGGSRLMRFPALLSSFNCRARRRLCMANASRGEYSGGASPAT
jgi:hypothetical protein